MKNLFCLPIILVLCLIGGPHASGTPVLFPLRQITGNPNLSRFSVIPDAWLNPQTDGTNLYGGFPLMISGASVTTNLQPGGYTLVVPGWAKTKHFNVNAGSSVVNVINCMTNLASWTNVTLGGGSGTFNFANLTNTPDLVTNNQPSVSFQTMTSGGNSLNMYANGTMDFGDLYGGFFQFQFGVSRLYGQSKIELNAPVIEFIGAVVFDSSTITNLDASALVSGKVPSARLPGISTNLQFTFGSTRTNTLYFTNGILMRVSQP